MSKTKAIMACVVCILAGAAAAAEFKDNPAVAASMRAMQKMHEAMMMDYTGDADVDFARGMIPHHQGAVAMARVELEYGKDPELRKLAENIIASQDAEIAMMQAWLKAHGR